MTNISTNCSQSIKHICTVNSLTKYSSWISRNGVVNTYWSGTRNPSDTGCQCSIDGNCVEDSICNCDSMRPNQIDDGILTDKSSLPVKSLRYGGSYASISSVKYVLGPLVCTGKERVWIISTKNFRTLRSAFFKKSHQIFVSILYIVLRWVQQLPNFENNVDLKKLHYCT